MIIKFFEELASLRALRDSFFAKWRVDPTLENALFVHSRLAVSDKYYGYDVASCVRLAEVGVGHIIVVLIEQISINSAQINIR